MFCKNCGHEIRETDKFCVNCGAALNEEPKTVVNEQPDDTNKTIGMWSYFGYEFLFSLPVVGLILAIVFSFAPDNENLRNFARSKFCWLIIALVLTIIILIISFATSPQMQGIMNYKFITNRALW